MQLGNPAKEAVAQTSTETHPAATNSQAIQAPVAVPKYLEQTYWWAYLHPRGVNFFERHIFAIRVADFFCASDLAQAIL